MQGVQPPPGVNGEKISGNQREEVPFILLFLHSSRFGLLVWLASLSFIYFLFVFPEIGQKCESVALGVWLNGEYGGAGLSWTW